MQTDEQNYDIFLLNIIPFFIRNGIITERMADSLAEATEFLGDDWLTVETRAAVADSAAHPRSVQSTLVAFHAIRDRAKAVRAESPFRI